MHKVKIILAGCLVLLASACRKYVEIPSQQERVLKRTSDYQSLLYSTTNIEPGYFYPIYAADEVGSDQATWQNNLFLTNANVYTWSESFFTSTQEDNDWSSLYKQIYICNTVVTGVMGSEEGTDLQKRSALASALVHRAFAYYTLVNIYAKQYDAATAATDPGVPLLVTTYLFADLTRASVQKVYDQILADLNQALPDLTDLPDFNTNPSKVAAYALLARTHLQMRHFADAERYADLALSLQNTLLDLNAYIAAPNTMPLKLRNPEEIFFKKASQFASSIPLTAKVLSLYDQKDLRYAIYTTDGTKISYSNFTGRGYNRQNIISDGIYIGPNVPEMMLIKAECEARAGNVTAALSQVNLLRKKRFTQADYYDLTAATANDALRTVIDERSREFIGRGFRWFDQRRLAKDEGLIGTVTRTFKGQTYTLKPGDNRYVFPIADKYIIQNPEIKQNPR
ncbi:RagB/SusD family nutrient uptake outer membrane protein [Mucilaginibacter sp. Bleaf8]|uniref:RagB/SusD family nutrient uptake outer membrane protein n=1 Tax=Mucilaginibacter sp. Bleaf8 TaxID=2834430 RepID=UPI001BCFA8B7|nr:RagB/SusD family nutrient uptake outer membrane protein [Mucilaginibacter sp. Bleaf8]MBS7565173.1 RagB/SusD family nutrient uptake outer membrane protein [Mucilaginibacter sp. Bleaf8]